MTTNTTQYKQLETELHSFVKNHLPALQRLEIAIEKADNESVILSAPLSANINDKGTAFGGSQYILALSSAWALTYLNMVNVGEKETQFVIAKAEIAYLRPTTSQRFFAIATYHDGITDFLDKAKAGERGKVSIKAQLVNDDPREKPTQQTNSELEALFALTSN